MTSRPGRMLATACISALCSVLAARGTAHATDYTWDFAASAPCAAIPATPVALCDSDYNASTITFADATNTYTIVARGYYLGSGTSPLNLVVGATTWTVASPTPNSHLWAKFNGNQAGADETGLGIADPNAAGNREIEKNNYIQLDLTALPANVQSVDLAISSLQSGETATVWGSSTRGQPGLLLASFVGPGAGGAAITSFHYDLSAGRYLTVSANPNYSGTNNVLIQSGFLATIPPPPTPTKTPAPTPTATKTPKPTPTPTKTPAPTPTPTKTPAPTPTPTKTPAPTPTPTKTPAPTPTPTKTPAPTPTATKTPAPTPTPTPTTAPTPTPTPLPTPTPTPTAQDVVEVCHHPCPDLIKFGKNGRPDSLLIRSTFPPGTVLDPANETFEIELSNPDGVIYDAVLQPGDLVKKKTFFLFLDPTAKKGSGFRQGLAKVQLWDAQANGGVRVLIQAYGDLSAADRPEMTIRITVGDDTIGRSDTWQKTAIGWSNFHH